MKSGGHLHWWHCSAKLTDLTSQLATCSLQGGPQRITPAYGGLQNSPLLKVFPGISTILSLKDNISVRQDSESKPFIANLAEASCSLVFLIHAQRAICPPQSLPKQAWLHRLTSTSPCGFKMKRSRYREVTCLPVHTHDDPRSAGPVNVLEGAHNPYPLGRAGAEGLLCGHLDKCDGPMLKGVPLLVEGWLWEDEALAVCDPALTCRTKRVSILRTAYMQETPSCTHAAHVLNGPRLREDYEGINASCMQSNHTRPEYHRVSTCPGGLARTKGRSACSKGHHCRSKDGCAKMNREQQVRQVILRPPRGGGGGGGV